MKDWLKGRARERSTWFIGVPGLILGLGQIFKVNEAESLAAVVRSAADSFASGDWQGGLALVGVGALGIIMEKQRRN